MNDISHNVGEVTAIEGKAQRYKGNLIIPLSSLGTGWDKMKGGGYEKQGGLIFEDEKIALELLNTLQEYFKRPMTVRKEVSSWFLNKLYDISLWIKVMILWKLKRRRN